MPMARSIMAGVRLGVFARLSKSPATSEQVADDTDSSPVGMRLLLDALAALEHVRRRDGRYELTDQARRWLDPESDTYIGTVIENSYDYWEWWSDLERVVQTGECFEIHRLTPDHPHWRRYIRGQFELARLSAPEVARSLTLPAEPRALLDVAGGHGWFAAAMCKRYPTLSATVLDLPGSAAVGRQIMAETEMSDRVEHVEGDILKADLGGPYDGALCFNIIHHLSPEQNVALFRRLRAVLSPGASLAVLDLFTPPADKQPDAAAFLGLFFYLQSAVGTYSPDDLRGWLRDAGFGDLRRIRIRRMPNQTLYEARREA
jgi:ubiquinone/menaquinone biosynthesis C-methylase UbiE